jgi:hypothetical protein
MVTVIISDRNNPDGFLSFSIDKFLKIHVLTFYGFFRMLNDRKTGHVQQNEKIENFLSELVIFHKTRKANRGRFLSSRKSYIA